jgi:hypothetical protein
MRFTFFVIALGFLSCSKPSTSSETTTDSKQTVTPTIAEAKNNTSAAVYVGFANYFEETKEFYVSLYYRGEERVESYGLVDSVVYDDGDAYFRKSIPMDKAQEHFYLEGLDTLRLYNADHQFLGTASLQRVEYVEAVTSSQYVAVYKFAHAYSDRYGPYYAVSDHIGAALQKDFSSQEIKDLALNALILENLKLDTANLWVMSHRRTKPSGRIYSTVNFGMQAFIVETHNDKSIIMDTMTDGYHFGLSVPVPIMVNGGPILLVTYFNPEGDDSGDYLMQFNGVKFEGAKYGRVEVK